MTPLQRWEGFNAWLSFLHDLKFLAKLGLSGLLLILAVNWFTGAVSPAVAVVGKGLIADAFHAVVNVFEKAKP